MVVSSIKMSISVFPPIFRFLTRHDVKQKKLPEFMDWALVSVAESESKCERREGGNGGWER